MIVRIGKSSECICSSDAFDPSGDIRTFQSAGIVPNSTAKGSGEAAFETAEIKNESATKIARGDEPGVGTRRFSAFRIKAALRNTTPAPSHLPTHFTRGTRSIPDTGVDT